MPLSRTHREVVQERLRLAEAYVELGERHIDYMQQRAADLAAARSDLADAAVRLLNSMLETQSRHVTERERLRTQLAELDAQISN